MNVDNSLVSVITPVFNSEMYLLETFQSLKSQTYSLWEWIIVDDCSQDASWDLMLHIASLDSRVRILRNDVNKGAGFSRNKAIEASNGRYIAFLDADDLWMAEKLEAQVNFMSENNFAFTYTQYQKFDSEGIKGKVIPPDSVSYNQLLYSNVIGCLTAMYDVELIGKRYMPLIRKRQDMGLWLEILKDIPHAYCLNRVLAKYRKDSGMTANKLKVLSYQWAFYRETVGLSFFRSCFVFSVYAVKGFLKHKG